MKSDSTKGKTVAVLAYFLVIGWFLALILNQKKRTALGTFHLRQALGIMSLAGLVFIVAGYFKLAALAIPAGFLAAVLLISGIFSAISGKLKPVPLVGKKFQEWFKSL